MCYCCFIFCKKRTYLTPLSTTNLKALKTKYMSKELHDMLCVYLGELKYDYDYSIEYWNQDEIAQKINAVNLLLGTENKS